MDLLLEGMEQGWSRDGAGMQQTLAPWPDTDQLLLLGLLCCLASKVIGNNSQHPRDQEDQEWTPSVLFGSDETNNGLHPTV
jgi:hypothetical protein